MVNLLELRLGAADGNGLRLILHLAGYISLGGTALELDLDRDLLSGHARDIEADDAWIAANDAHGIRVHAIRIGQRVVLGYRARLAYERNVDSSLDI